MSRYVFPDPNDRSANQPSVIAKSSQVLGLYNQNNDDEDMQRVTTKVQEWFITEAKQTYKWDDAYFSGNQCVLTATMEQRKIP